MTPAREAPAGSRCVPLRPIEIAYGLAIGRTRGVDPLRPGADGSPRAVLERVLAGALSRPPCLVSFSGGRDSSALLAVAAAVARREGLPEPIPATLVFPGASESDEREWQELVLDTLGLADWQRFELTGELDAIGPVAGPMMRRHGLVWPFNLHYHVPIMEAARGGTVVTGFAGDELANSCGLLRGERLTWRQARRHPRILAAKAYRWLPRVLRWPRERWRAGTHVERMEVTWLTSRGRRDLEREFARESVPHRGWDRIVRDDIWPSRFFQVCRDNFQIVADDHDVTMVHPFVEPEVLRALAAHAGPSGLRGREEILALLVGDLLPRELIARQSKATFTSTLWTPSALEFARRWNGSRIDADLVDREALGRAWADSPPPLTTTLLQSVWLAEQATA